MFYMLISAVRESFVEDILLRSTVNHFIFSHQNGNVKFFAKTNNELSKHPAL